MNNDTYAKRVKCATLSEIRIMMAAAPPNSIHLGLGEPDFQPPDPIIEALKKAVDNGHNHYGPTLGLKELRMAIVDSLKSLKRDLTLDNVMVTLGATGGLMLAMQAFIDTGDEVLLPNPGFVLYEPQVAFCDGKPVFYHLKKESDFQPDIEEIKSMITPKTKMILVNSPSNPTGGVLEEEHVKALVDLALDNDLIIVSDEVYDELVYQGKHHSFLGRYDKLVYVNSFSKTLAMTGWRMGYIAADKDTIKHFEKIQYLDIACPPTPFQYALIEALRIAPGFTKKMLSEFRTRRDFIVDELNAIEGFHCPMPRGSIFAFPSYDHKIPSKDFAMKILKEGVICGPGSSFGSEGEGHLRFTYANTIDNIKKGIEVVERVAGTV